LTDLHELEIGLHKNQMQIYYDPHRFKVVCCGRQFGKTTFCSFVGAQEAIQVTNGTGYVVSVDASRSKILFDAILKKVPYQYVESVSAKWMNFTLTNGTKLWCKSAESPKSLPGSQLDFLFVDEAALCDEEVWHLLLPALMRNPKSKVWLVSTPRGKNWFYEAFLMEHTDPDFKSFHFSSYDNPTITKKEVDRMAKHLPELMYRQEIMAEFIEGGIVFRNLERVMQAAIKEPVPRHSYVMGVDLAKYNDWNVIKVGDTGTNSEVFQIRNNRLDWDFQKSSIYMTAKRYNNATIIIDKTGVGDAVVEDLSRMDRAYKEAPVQGYLNIVPVAFSTVSKPELYKHYILMQENDLIWLLPDPVTKYEHETFECEMMPSGYIRYCAAKNRNDDTVTASALMAWGFEKIFGSAVIGGLGDFDPTKKPKPPIDPSTQLDIDKLIGEMESKQVARFGGMDNDDLDILSSYSEEY